MGFTGCRRKPAAQDVPVATAQPSPAPSAAGSASSSLQQGAGQSGSASGGTGSSAASSAQQGTLPHAGWNGKVSQAFSGNTLVYNPTLGDWRTHNGLDIQAAEGDAVKTAASGMVVSIKSDELMGTTVVIEHAGGYTTQYSCLQAEPPVTEGQQVAAGDIIGLVGSTAAAESSMGPHLHFSVAKDGVIIDPSEYIG